MHNSRSNLPAKDIDLFVLVQLQIRSAFQNQSQGSDPEVSDIRVNTETSTGLLTQNSYYLGILSASLSLRFVLKTQRLHGTINMINMELIYSIFELL